MRKELMNFSMQEPGVRVLLPVAQEYDKDPDLRQGQCFGFTTYLIMCLARGNAPFGIRPDLPIPFQYKPSVEWTQDDLKLDSDERALRKEMYDLNHLARVTDEIKKYQTYDHNLSKFDKNFTIKLCGVGLADSPEELATKLCDLAKKNPGVGLNINLKIPNWGHLEGHSVGIRLRADKKIDFFDSNHGWFEFENEHVFVKWSSEWAKSYNLKMPLQHSFIYEATAFYYNATSALKAKIKINNARMKFVTFLRDFITNSLVMLGSKFSKNIFQAKSVEEKKDFSQSVIVVENKEPKGRKLDSKSHRCLQTLGIDVSLKAEKRLKRAKQTSEMATRSKDDSDTIRTKLKEFKLPLQAPKLESHDYKNKQLGEESKQPSEEKHAGLKSSPKARH